jgi:hypothetical protein
MDKAMSMTPPGTVPSRRWQRSSGARPSIELRENAVRDAGPCGAAPATVVVPASLQRSNLQFFLRSITESPRHK